MKPETTLIRNHRRSSKILPFTVLLLFSSTVYSQKPADSDSLINFPARISAIDIDIIRLSYTGSPFYSPSGLIPSTVSADERTLVFLDSLKNKASKTLITRKLYDFVIIQPVPSVKKEIAGPSYKTYQGHTGKIIRKIVVQRLNVFGTDVNTPGLNKSNNLEKFLNNTHFNTSEAIIRKNILFTEGDTVSSLILSDNERLIRQLPFIDDARIMLVPVTENQVDVIVVTKDIYSLGAKIDPGGFDKGSFSVFEKNVFGMGHEFGIEVPFDNKYSDSPGFGVHYLVNNFKKTFIDLNMYYLDGLGKKTYGFDLSRKFVSSATKYAGGISIREMFTSDDLDTLEQPAQVKYNLQDYWLSRSFLLNKESVSRFIIGARYTNNNVFARPYILPESFHRLQRYKMLLASASFSIQKYYKASLVYGYGRTEDIPYGGLLNFTYAKEINEFKSRTYLGTTLSIGESVKRIGYFYSSAGFATFLNRGRTEQGMLSIRTNYISNLVLIGRYRMRNFLEVDYTRGFDRYLDESLVFNCENGFSGFRNDSICGAQRLSLSIESVLFSPVNFYGFKFAVFGFADLGYLFGTNEFVGSGEYLSAIGLGIRIRNDNLILNTLQIRLGFFPNLPLNSSVNHLSVSGEQLLKPYNFEPGPPSTLPYR